MLQGWHRLTFNFLSAVLIGWWTFHITSNYLFVAIIAGAVALDFAVTFYLWLNRSKKAFRFLQVDTMPKTTTYAELWKQVAFSTILHLFIVIAGVSIMAVAVFKTPVAPIIVGASALAILVPQRYWSLRRHYRPIEAQGGTATRHQLEFVADAEGVYGSKLLSVTYVGLVIVVMTSLAIWLIAQ